MKKFTLVIAILLANFSGLFAQSLPKIGPNGIVVPLFTETNRLAISSPEIGLIVYQTDATVGFYSYNGSSWERLMSSGTNYLPLTGGALTGALYSNSDIYLNNVTVGTGPGAEQTNTVIGKNAFISNASGTSNVAIGNDALHGSSSGTNNTVVGAGAVYYNSTSNYITALGWHALHAEQGEGNTAIGYETGARGPISNSLTNSTFLGRGASAGGGTIDNATAIGSGAYVDASNKIQLGNGGVTLVNTSGAFTSGGAITGSSFVKSGGTSSEFLKADGSVDANTYLSSSSTLPVSSGGSGLTTISNGSILFGDGTNPLGTSSNLFWDNTNSRLGLLTQSPSTTFQIGNDNSAENLKWGILSGENTLQLGYRQTGWKMKANNNSGVITDLLFSRNDGTSDTDIMSLGQYSGVTVYPVLNAQTSVTSPLGNFTSLNINNGQIYYNNTDDKVGIFTQSPTSKFQVYGDGGFDYPLKYDNLNNSGILKFGFRSKEFRLTSTSDSGVLNRLSFKYFDGTSENESMYLDNNGNVGITNLIVNSVSKSGGTSSQFLKADGSVDANTYLSSTDVSSTYLPLSGGTLTGLLSNTNNEFFRVKNSSGYLTGFNDDQSIRTGYLQFNSGSNIKLIAEELNNLILGAASQNTLILNADQSADFNGAVRIPASLTVSNSASISGDATIGGSTTSTGLITALNNEAVRMKGNTSFISGYNSDASIRTGYLQFNSGSDVKLIAEELNTLILGSAHQNTLTLNADQSADFNGAVRIPASLTVSTSASISGDATIGGSTTSTGLITALSNEALRMKGNTSFISGYNSDASIRTGYLQFNSGSDVKLIAEELNTLVLGAAHQNTLTLNADQSATFGGVVNATSYVKTGGTSSQFLKADGSVDANTYLSSTDVSSTYLALSGGALTGGLSGTTASLSSTLDVTGITTLNANLAVKNGASAAGVAIYEASGSGTNKVTIQSQSMTADYTLTLPVDDGTSSQVLTTDGSGNLSWTTAGSYATVVSASSNVMLDTSPNQLVIVTGEVTITLPSNPVAGQMVTLVFDGLGVNYYAYFINSNGKDVFFNSNWIESGSSLMFSSNMTTTGILMYNGTKWYLVGEQ